MQDIYIVCDGPSGLRVLSLIQEINNWEKARHGADRYCFKGFLCENPDWLDRFDLRRQYKGQPGAWSVAGSEAYAMGEADPERKKELSRIMQEAGAEFVSLVSPRARTVMAGFKMGKGCIVTAGSSIKRGACIGDFVTILGSMFGAGSVVGSYSTIQGPSNMTNAQLGEAVFVGWNAVIMTDHKKIVIDDGAVIKPGSNVVNNVSAGVTVSGNPARKVRMRT